MRILLTGGSGDLGSVLSASFKKKGFTPVVLDMVAPREEGVKYVHGSLLNRDRVADAMKDVDVVIHIAAWHGVHEKTKTPAEFHDLNVTGTFNVLEAAAQAGVKKVIFISSTSVRDVFGIYGHTKILGEEMTRAYAHRHGMDIITLRPRAFIPSWNRKVYPKFTDWAKWFMRGAVHIDDVAQSVYRALDFLKADKKTPEPAQAFTIDGAYDFTTADVARHPELRALMEKHGLDPEMRPRILGSQEAEEVLGYKPLYSFRDALKDLEMFGEDGPPSPFDARRKPRPPRLTVS